MDNKQYLDTIAKDTRSASSPKKSLFGLDSIKSPLAKKILLGAGVAIILIMIIGIIVGIINGSGNKEQEYTNKIYLRSSLFVKETPAYTKLVKSSKLRSMGTSLISVLNETQYSLITILKDDFGIKNPEKPENEKILEEENNIMAEYLSNLENAHLNGLLDRTYLRELTFQIGTLISLEHEALSVAKNSRLESALNTSIENLNQLYEQFQDYNVE